jgi:ATP/maltotriose-dependent transcriptional regulator MalT
MAPPNADLAALRAIVHLMARDFEAAAAALDLARQDLERHGPRLVQIDVLSLEAALYLRNGQPDLARRRLREAATLGRRWGALSAELRVLVFWSSVPQPQRNHRHVLRSLAECRSRLRDATGSTAFREAGRLLRDAG